MASASASSGDSIRVGIVGVSGYSGLELARLISRHPRLTLSFASSDKWAGKRLSAKLTLPPAVRALNVVSQDQAKAIFGEVDIVFLCTPAEVSIELAPKVLAAGARVVDLSGAFRLAPSEYPAWYGFEHPSPALLGEAVYSMPEATGNNAGRLRAARLVSNPGCFATVATLSVLPLAAAGLIEAGTLIIDGKSGTTGAGRRAAEEYSFSEVDGDIRAYRVLRHQHTPEIERTLALAGVPAARVVFTSHLLPARRGILVTSYGRLTPAAIAAGDVQAAVSRTLDSFAEAHPFVQVVTPEEVTLASVVGTNRVVLGAKVDVSRGIVVICASLDNLVKGAAGQAVQNANLMFGLPETLGLDDLVGHAP